MLLIHRVNPSSMKRLDSIGHGATADELIEIEIGEGGIELPSMIHRYHAIKMVLESMIWQNEAVGWVALDVCHSCVVAVAAAAAVASLGFAH